jgi:arylsulfatase A-like enzyme
MGELFKGVGYATAIFGKWHLGGAPESLPTAHGFDEFYGIPPDISWDAATYPETIALTHSLDVPYETLLKTGPQIGRGQGRRAVTDGEAFHHFGARKHRQ